MFKNSLSNAIALLKYNTHYSRSAIRLIFERSNDCINYLAHHKSPHPKTELSKAALALSLKRAPFGNRTLHPRNRITLKKESIYYLTVHTREECLIKEKNVEWLTSVVFMIARFRRGRGWAYICEAGAGGRRRTNCRACAARASPAVSTA